MMRRPASLPVACAVAACLGLQWQAAAQAQSETPRETRDAPEAVDNARAHFKLGVDFFKERNYRGAQIEFRTAYQLSPNYKLLYNLAQASVELQEYASAIDDFTRYLNESGSDLSAARRHEVESVIQSLKDRMASVSVLSNQPDAEVYLDDTLVGRLPLANKLAVSAGRHKVVARKPGLVTVEAIVDLAAGEERTLRLDFTPVAIAAHGDTSGSRTGATSQGRHLSSEVIWTSAATGALLIGGAAMSLVTLGAEHEYDATRRTLTSAEALHTLRQHALTKARVTDVLWGAALISATVTVVLFVSGQDQREQPSAPSVALNVTPAAASLSFHTGF